MCGPGGWRYADQPVRGLARASRVCRRAGRSCRAAVATAGMPGIGWAGGFARRHVCRSASGTSISRTDVANFVLTDLEHGNHLLSAPALATTCPPTAAYRISLRAPCRGGGTCARPSRRLYVPPQVRSPRQTLLFRAAACISDLDPTPATYLAGQTHPLYDPFITAAPWITALAPNVPAQCRACDPDGSRSEE